jgi:hypothetical protein
MKDDDEFGAASGMIGRGNRSTLRIPAPPQIPDVLTWAGTQATLMGSQRMAARVMAWPYETLILRNNEQCLMQEVGRQDGFTASVKIWNLYDESCWGSPGIASSEREGDWARSDGVCRSNPTASLRMAFIVVIHKHGLHGKIMRKNESTNRSKTVDCTDPRKWFRCPWKWKQYIPWKRGFIYRPHGAVSQKMATAPRISAVSKHRVQFTATGNRRCLGLGWSDGHHRCALWSF